MYTVFLNLSKKNTIILNVPKVWLPKLKEFRLAPFSAFFSKASKSVFNSRTLFQFRLLRLRVNRINVRKSNPSCTILILTWVKTLYMLCIKMVTILFCFFNPQNSEKKINYIERAQSVHRILRILSFSFKKCNDDWKF